MKILKDFTKRMFNLFFRKNREISLGFYGPPNAGKTSLANAICKDWTGEPLGKVSDVPHETRNVQFKEKVEIEHKGKKLTFKIADTPGIATRVDYEDFLKFKMKKKADIKKIESAFPEYEVVGISARKGKNMEEFYESLFRLSKKV